MTNTHASLSHMLDHELAIRVQRCAADERQTTAQLIAALAEFDARRLYLEAGCSSLFTFCTQVLHLSEHAAYHRIEAARAARRFPLVLVLLTEGALTLTTVGLVACHLTTENHREVLEAARHKSKREVEQIVARLRPQPDVPSTVRRLPVSNAVHSNPPAPAAARSEMLPEQPPSPAALPAHPRSTRSATVTPLAPERYKLQCTLSHESYQKLRRAQDLLRHAVPNGDPAEILERALALLVATLEKNKLAATTRPRAARPPSKRSRHIPAGVRRAVWARDGERCAFVGTAGRCHETAFLEIHHVVPYAAGGQAVVHNLQVRCRAHNQYEAEQHFGAHGSWFARETPGCLHDWVRT